MYSFAHIAAYYRWRANRFRWYNDAGYAQHDLLYDRYCDYAASSGNDDFYMRALNARFGKP